MKKHSLAFIDLETTGLEPGKHEIIEIGCIIVSQKEVDGKIIFEEKEAFEIKVKPINLENADHVSLRINHYNEADWLFAVDLNKALEVLSIKVKNSIMVAHNVIFDWNFLDKAFTETGVENSLHYHKLDTISIAFAKLYKNPEIQRFSLKALCEYFGIENKKAHSALSDTRATYELFIKLMEL